MVEKIKIVCTVLTIATTIIISAVNIFKEKNKTNRLRKINKLAQIVQKLPQFIKESELLVGAGNGDIKNRLVLNQCQIECDNQNVEFIENDFKAEIEKILETPQKKKENENDVA